MPYLSDRKTAPNAQLLAFQHIVTLATLFPGLRLLFLQSEYLKREGSKDSLEMLWERSDKHMNEEWKYWCSFAAICLSEICISGVVEKCRIEELANSQVEIDGRSVIDRLM